MVDCFRFCVFIFLCIVVAMCDLVHVALTTFEPHHEKTNILHMRKQRRRSASR